MKNVYRKAECDHDRNTVDFQKGNVLNYLYDVKHHKSYDLRKKNEHVQSLMRDQFVSQRDIQAKHEVDLM